MNATLATALWEILLMEYSSTIKDGNTFIQTQIHQQYFMGFHYISIENHQCSYPPPALAESYWQGIRWP